VFLLLYYQFLGVVCLSPSVCFFLFQVNNLALLASVTLQKVLNINNNNNNQHCNNKNRSHSSDIKQSEQQKPQQPQRRYLDIKSESDVLSQLLKTGAVFTPTPTAPIAIERKKQSQQQQQHQYAQQQQPHHHQQQQCSAQKQRLNSSISSTHSSTSTNSSYGSSSSEDAAAASATLATTTPRANTTKASSIKLPEKSKIPSDILDDLASRFIINVPDLMKIAFTVLYLPQFLYPLLVQYKGILDSSKRM